MKMTTKVLDDRLRRRARPRAIDLFAGCGGLTLGLKQAGYRVVAAVEIDKVAASTYRRNHKSVFLEESDIRLVSAAKLLRQLKLHPRDLDLLAGCPPCQGFSSLRTRNRSRRNRDNRNGLLTEMLRFARVLQPKAIMMENVPGLIKHRSFKIFCRGLRSLGYKLKFEIKDAANYGVPQRRRRLILIAGRDLSPNFAQETAPTRTVRSAIGGLSRPGKSRDVLHNLPEQRSARVLDLIKMVPRDGGSRSDLPRNRQLKCHRRTDGFHDIYGRMAWDAPAPTLTSGCFNPSKGRFLHPDQDRAITMREAALLQGFPKNYFFDTEAGKQAIALMIGNALPPEFIKRHATAIRKSIRPR